MSIRRPDNPQKPAAKDAEQVPAQQTQAEQASAEEESRLSRWSRRKRAAERSDSESLDLENPVDQTLASTVSHDLPLDSLTDVESDSEENPEAHAIDEAPLLTDADMPDVDTLTPDSDFKPFMSKGVSHALRRKALRKLFASPFFQVRDGLDDYDDDFTSFAPLGDTVTADMKYAEERKEMLRQEAEEEERQKREQLASDVQSDDVESQDESDKDESDKDKDESTSDAQLAGDQPVDAEQVESPAIGPEAKMQTTAKTPASTAPVRGGGFDEYDVDEDV